MANTSGSNAASWTWEDDKLFENCLVEFTEDTADRWKKIAARLGTKSAAEVERHYALLVDDVAAIVAGTIEPPAYVEKDVAVSSSSSNKKQTAKQKKPSRAWTQDEHKLFLDGLKKYGKGDWKSISRHSVITRNPTQVASHAQKHFQRQENIEDQKKKRWSIFDS